MTALMMISMIVCPGAGSDCVPSPPICAGPLEEMSIHLTTYWPFDENNTLLPGWQGQCDADCSTMANGTKVTLDLANRSAACIQEWVWVGRSRMSVNIDGYGSFVCNDAYGAESYREPFFDEDVGKCVIGVDVLSPNLWHDTIPPTHWYSEVITEVAD